MESHTLTPTTLQTPGKFIERLGQPPAPADVILGGDGARFLFFFWGGLSITVIAHQWQLTARPTRALEMAGNGAHLITTIHHARGHKTDTQPRSYTHKWESLRDTCV